MFKDMDFLPGIVTYNDLDKDLITSLKQMHISEKDLMQVSYPHGFLLDIGWRNNEYIVCLIKNCNWVNRIFKKKCKTLEDLTNTLRECVNYAKVLVAEENTKKLNQRNILDGIDYSPGEINYSDLYVDPVLSLKKNSKEWPEYILQITYPTGIVIDLRKNNDELILSIVRNWQWESPICSKIITTIDELEDDLKVSINKIRELIKTKE